MSDEEGVLGVDDGFGLDSSDGGGGNQVLNLDAGESSDEPQPGDGGADPIENADKVENQPFDEVVEINDSEEVESDEDAEPALAGQQEPAPLAESAPTPGAYNPADYADLNVDDEVRELFEYIGRFKPQSIELDSVFRPFVPDYIPAVGEVDAALKMPQPTGEDETLGIMDLDEPCLNPTDDKVLEMKYLQKIKTVSIESKKAMTVKTVDNAEKNHKEVTTWIKNVSELHKGRPAPTVNFTKTMPDYDVLMEQWPEGMERTL